MAETYLPIRLNTLRGEEAVTFDVYLKLGNRYLHYSRPQDELEGIRLKKLKTSGVKKMFILTQDEDIYLKYLETGINNLNDKSKNVDERGALAHDAMVMAAENAEKNLETQEGFDAQKKQFDKITDFIISDRNALKSMLSSAGISVDNNHHAANVSSLALAMASKCGIKSKMELFELGTAALLHDIGKNRWIDQEFRTREQMNPTQLKQFKSHPQDGVDMLAGKPYISPRILGLIGSHEELGEGKGFPEKKNVLKLDLSYQILILTNQFDHFATANNLELAKAIDPFFEKCGKDHDEELINILATVLT